MSARRNRRLKITQSEFGVLRSCRRKWELTYEMQLRPVYAARPLRVGTLIHVGISEMYAYIRDTETAKLDAQSNDEVFSNVVLLANFGIEAKSKTMEAKLITDEEVEEQRDAAREAGEVAYRFMKIFAVEDARRYEVLGIEQNFEVPLRNSKGTDRGCVSLVGQFDQVLRDRWTGGIVLGENKSTQGDACFYDLRSDIDPQPRAYNYALTQLYPNEEVGRTQYNVARKKGPRDPRLNKDGTVSAAAIDTTYDRYEDALLDQEAALNKPRTEKQQARLDGLPKGYGRYVHRHELTYGPDQIETWRSDAYEDARLARLVRRGVVAATRNGAFCRSYNSDCAYRSVCDEYSEEAAGDRLQRIEHRHPELHDISERENDETNQE